MLFSIVHLSDRLLPIQQRFVKHLTASHDLCTSCGAQVLTHRPTGYEPSGYVLGIKLTSRLIRA